MENLIRQTLQGIEITHDVTILYACESGSRAWQFPSKDSDYDVRFIYVHKKADYLAIDPIGIGKKRDVIELPINDLLDVSGWELTKALRLLRKSNPPLMEWLRSGIVYYQAYSTIAKIKSLSKGVFTPQSCLHHYLNMAEGNLREYLQGEEVRTKKYFYVLRPVLAAKWIETYNEFPPLEFPLLVDRLLPEGELKREIYSLLERKLAGEELDQGRQIAIINQFLIEEIERLRVFTKNVKVTIPDFTQKLDQIFRETLEEITK
ncbi:nucleotidyltransferase domain-containing protein [Bacillus rubiinfantis]|uniref:nucleotidyltransferase domain-containing protein n=1 Tax=Bacillus rubiinfantis TaxID=1499680 RepID=UPI0005AB4863|nr:nucleotidyltransferase domain-containing protein [Bacillus rubiinfantis]